ncbi:hypothetical protein ASD12_18100 [Mesorhizobium sp. Root102]|uniref:hypothetical protein n=1 Tax=Mesorhizobium sp. Root102 TaxID=1736422 RepID=UPI0006F9898E|nr:hypothetical protein [Mesorhizobium sp. Root102]KQU77713.1 hypothetical protein ASD12_18100 [Mesorhizobium sp. Root102]
MATLARDWEGETAFVLAGGPSVLDLDLSLLKGRRVIAINSAHLAWPDADALFYADAGWWTDTGWKEPAFAGEIFTTSPVGGPKTVKRLVKIKPASGVSTDPGRVALDATSVSGAINIAIHRGVARIVLLGVDGCLGSDGRRHHHGGLYPNPLRKGWFDRHRAELEGLARSIRALGVEVINCSPVSHVACWPKMSFGDVLSMLDRAR